MLKLKSRQPLLRSIWSLLAVTIILTGVTFAALQSQTASLTGNTVSSATAFLLISNDGTTFNNTKSGFNFANIIPGGAAVSPTSGGVFYLKNTGTANLSIKVAVSSTPSNPNNADLSKVFLVFTRVDNGTQTSFSVKSLVDSFAGGGVALGDTISAGTTLEYTVKASMAIDAYNGFSGATVSGIDLSFSGTGV